MLDRAVHGVREDVELDRADVKIVGPRAQRAHDGLHAPLPREHDHRRVREHVCKPLAELDAVHSGHGDVGDHERDVVVLVGERQRLDARPGHDGPAAVPSYDICEHVARVVVVVDDENADRTLGSRGHCVSPFEGE